MKSSSLMFPHYLSTVKGLDLGVHVVATFRSVIYTLQHAWIFVLRSQLRLTANWPPRSMILNAEPHSQVIAYTRCFRVHLPF